MADILKKMNASRTDIPYSAMIEFAAKAEKEAKASAHQELLAANNKAIMANNKADAAEAERKHAEAQVKDMLAQMVELKKSITSLETKNEGMSLRRPRYWLLAMNATSSPTKPLPREFA